MLLTRLAAAAVAATLLGAAAGERMHLQLLSSSPASDAVVAAPLRELRLVYNLRPELGLSDVKLLTAAGTPHPVGKVTLDSLTLVVPVPTPPPPGRYTISWRTASSDGHPIRGTIPFEVAPPAVGSAEGAAPVHLSRDHTVR